MEMTFMFYKKVWVISFSRIIHTLHMSQHHIFFLNVTLVPTVQRVLHYGLCVALILLSFIV